MKRSTNESPGYLAACAVAEPLRIPRVGAKMVRGAIGKPLLEAGKLRHADARRVSANVRGTCLGGEGMRAATGKGIGGHHNPVPKTDDWITPQWVANAMGLFDLDPCECEPQPWPMADTGYSIHRGQNGLLLPWHGSVFVNPPYSSPEPWAESIAKHGDGVLLTFARVETGWWQDWIWPNASAIWFPRGRLTFCYPDGTPAKHNSGGPTAVAAFGDKCSLLMETMRERFGGHVSRITAAKGAKRK